MYLDDLLHMTFTLIEEQQEQQYIDIQEIIELVEIQTPDYREVQVGQNRAKINELIRAIKQLDRDRNNNIRYCHNCGAILDKENTALPNMCWECKYGKEK